MLLIIIRTIPGLNSINLAADVAVGGGDGVLAVNEVEAWTRNMRQTEATCRARSMARSGLKLRFQLPHVADAGVDHNLVDI